MYRLRPVACYVVTRLTLKTVYITGAARLDVDDGFRQTCLTGMGQCKLLCTGHGGVLLHHIGELCHYPLATAVVLLYRDALVPLNVYKGIAV